MPKKLERKLRREANQKWPGQSKTARERRDAYIYGTLRKTGWTPSESGRKSGSSSRTTNRRKSKHTG